MSGSFEPGWYRRSFGRDYLTVYTRRDARSAAEEVAFLVDAISLAGAGPVLDVGCGAGRHLAALVRRGIDAWGIDLSRPLLAEGRRAHGLGARLIRGDMRALPFGRAFEAVLSLFSSFGYFLDGENDRALAEMARVLRPGGRLVLDLMNPRAVARGLRPRTVRERGGVRIDERRRIDGARVVKEIRVEEVGTGRRRSYLESVRLYELDELRPRLDRLDLAIEGVYGAFARAPYGPGSPRMLILARKGTGGGDE